jgi:outer membrane protein OmpA-like peptidoglycan-associated protein
MKFFFTAIVLITFHFASAQNDTSGTLKSYGDSVLFTDFKPVYIPHESKTCTINIYKIEYTKNEMILYLCIVNNNKEDIFFPIFKRKDNQCFLKSEKKIFYKHNIKNIVTNGSLSSIGTTPKDSVVECQIKKGGKLTCEINFPRLPKEIKTVSLILLENSDDDNPFKCFNIQIKSSGDDINNKKEKDLLNKMELNKPLTLNNIYFETGKSNLLDSSYSELNILFNVLKSKPKMILQISGYTDNVGKVQDNIILSETRANAVKKYLSNKGIENNRIIAKGYGSSNPKANNNTKEGRAQNRRVEITVLKNK